MNIGLAAIVPECVPPCVGLARLREQRDTARVVSLSFGGFRFIPTRVLLYVCARGFECGCEVAERFIQRLFRNDAVSWKAQRFAHWIEPEGSPRSVSVDWSTLPVVRCGEYPDFGPW